jgi:hypothetical protein
VNISIQVNTGRLEDALHLLAKQARVAPGVVIKEETKAIAQQIIRITPPRNLAQGRKAVAGDVNRIVYAPDAENVKWPPLKQAIQKRDVAKAAALFANKREPRFTFTSSQAEIRAQHERMRTRRGRVSKGVKPNLAAFPREAGRYLRDVQSRVGWAKGSWVRALQSAGGTAPSWISRHSAKSGSVVANYGENPSVLAIAHRVKIPNYQRMVDAAVATRVRITERKISRLVTGKAVNLGFMVVEAR